MKTSHLAITLILTLLVIIFGNIVVSSYFNKKNNQVEQKQVEAPPPPVDPKNTSVFKFNLDYNSVFVMKVDGKEYIVVSGHNRLAICPK